MKLVASMNSDLSVSRRQSSYLVKVHATYMKRVHVESTSLELFERERSAVSSREIQSKTYAPRLCLSATCIHAPEAGLDPADEVLLLRRRAAGEVRRLHLAEGGSATTCESPLNVLKDTYDHSCH
jgi:hypothetical protein